MKHPPLSPAQIARVIEATSGELNAWLEVAYASGGRVSEVCALTWGSVDLEAGTVRLQGKGADERLVPVGRPALAALRSLACGRGCMPARLETFGQPSPALAASCDTGRNGQAHTPPGEPGNGGIRSLSGPCGVERMVLPSSDSNPCSFRGGACVLDRSLPFNGHSTHKTGKDGASLGPTDRVFPLLTPQQVRDRLRTLGRRLGLQVSPHDFRRAFTTHLLNNGASIRAVQGMLGHSRCDTTRIYWQQTEPRLQALSESVMISLPRARAFVLSHPATFEDISRKQLDP